MQDAAEVGGGIIRWDDSVGPVGVGDGPAESVLQRPTSVGALYGDSGFAWVKAPIRADHRLKPAAGRLSMPARSADDAAPPLRIFLVEDHAIPPAP